MSKFARRHYQLIAETLARANAGPDVILTFVQQFKADNARFHAQRFRDAVEAERARIDKLENYLRTKHHV